MDHVVFARFFGAPFSTAHPASLFADREREGHACRLASRRKIGIARLLIIRCSSIAFCPVSARRTQAHTRHEATTNTLSHTRAAKAHAKQGQAPSAAHTHPRWHRGTLHTHTTQRSPAHRDSRVAKPPRPLHKSRLPCSPPPVPLRPATTMHSLRGSDAGPRLGVAPPRTDTYT